MAALPEGTVWLLLEGALHQENKGRLAQREISGALLNRPPMSASRLRHYDGGAVVHHYLAHHTRKHKLRPLSQEEMIGGYISHVPARHFKVVRYSGFLTNCRRGTLLPGAYDTLQISARREARVRGADEGFSGHVPVQMHPVRGQTSLCKCPPDRRARDGIALGKAAWDGEKTMAPDA
ncbi:transposase [Erwinia tracheiphila]|uniref:Transposase IS801/IS1294 domain-containing protein n=1 Tax=Erwinia tracheiphila TaxID=65700 RepID=A0A345CV10_9GAMM|nr:transposase [Erwinia tracheiphila]AXF77277.1 hypothetical protein AV903_16525 [Erwinia tracheiphila]EOS95026.1 transposase [Erwinia tracheiphila PSU-1]UIA84031.1 transposase [Erwinia tracheiphila]UIA87470.1 transposase [Erwinia tracheiphila]UIA92613.1 transposase [Erwinia tracheiphila]